MPQGPSVTAVPPSSAQRLVGIDVQHGRLAPVVGVQDRRGERRPRPPAGTSRSTSAARGRRRRRPADVDPVRRARASPTAGGSRGPTATTTCSTSIGPALVCTRVTASEPSSSKPAHLDPLGDLGSRRARLRRQPEHRLAVEGEAAAVLVQADAQALGPPVAEQAAHVRAHRVLADVQLRRVADRAAGARRPRPGRAPGRAGRARCSRSRGNASASGSDSQISTQAAISSCIAGWK